MILAGKTYNNYIMPTSYDVINFVHNKFLSLFGARTCIGYYVNSIIIHDVQNVQLSNNYYKHKIFVGE